MSTAATAKQLDRRTLPKAAPRYTPSWSSGAYITREVPVPNLPTQFDLLVQRLGLENRPDLWPDSAHLLKFAKQFRHSRYIPEALLEAFGFDEEIEL